LALGLCSEILLFLRALGTGVLIAASICKLFISLAADSYLLIKSILGSFEGAWELFLVPKPPELASVSNDN